MVKVQFELNGHSRTTNVEQRSTAQASMVREGRAVADPENPLDVAPPMPSSVVKVAVQLGQRVAAGSTLMALEAMAMATHIAADRDCVIAAVHVKPGERVATYDLLIEPQVASGRVVWISVGCAAKTCMHI